jgi:signal transduction histidine kinase
VDTETQQTIIDTATDRDLLVLILKATDHLDEQLHEVRQFIADNRPALERATKLLHNPVSEYLAARKAGK